MFRRREAQTQGKPILGRSDIVVSSFHVTVALLSLIFSFALAACSIPVLESPECQSAKLAVREFYSYHFGNDMNFTAENLSARERFLAPELRELLRDWSGDYDPFTLARDLPSAFKLGGCTVAEGGEQAHVEVVLFWKTETGSEQRIVRVRTVKRQNDWLIDDIERAG